MVRKKFLFWLPALLLAWCLLPGLAWAAPTELDLDDDVKWGCLKLGGGWVSNEDFNDKVKLGVLQHYLWKLAGDNPRPGAECVG